MSTPEAGLVGRVLDRATSRSWVLLFAALQLAVLAGVGVRYHANLRGLTDASGRVVTGDFPAFYTAGHMIASGQGRALYDLAAQKRTQSQLLGRPSDVWQPFPYPPLLAVAMAPLAHLDGLSAFRVHGACMLFALCLGLWSLRAALPWHSGDRRRALTALLLVLAFAPLFRAVIGGQNTPLTVALLSASLAALASGRPIAAGCWLGLCSYKPQLLPLLLLSLALSGQGRALVAFAAVCLAHYALGALVAGADWPRSMLAMLARYEGTEHSVNLSTHISAIAAIRHAQPGALGWALCALVLAAMLALVVRSTRAGAAPSWSFAVALTCAMVASPHLQYYDVAVVALPVLVAVDLAHRRDEGLSRLARALLVAGYLLYPVYALQPLIGVQPLLLWLLWPLAWLWRMQPTAGVKATSAT